MRRNVNVFDGQSRKDGPEWVDFIGRSGLGHDEALKRGDKQKAPTEEKT